MSMRLYKGFESIVALLFVAFLLSFIVIDVAQISKKWKNLCVLAIIVHIYKSRLSNLMHHQKENVILKVEINHLIFLKKECDC